MFYIHKGTISKCTKKMSEEEIQEFLNNGWEPGKCPAHWVNNGIDDILLKEGLPMPDGYVYGQSDIFKQKNSVGGKRRWKEATEEKREEWSQAASKATAEMWSRLSDEEKQLREINRMNTRDNWTEEERKCYSEKMSESAKRDRATRTPEEYKLSADKGFETRRKRKNFNTSSYEQELYKVLVERFGVQDICAEYKEDRYPFHCDFYIKSLDLFIELNLHWTHGKHPFNSNNPEDLVELERIHSKQCLTPDGKENSFFVYEKVWTGYDVQKLKLAKQNKLNYILIYSKEEFSNLKQQIIEGSVLL